MNGGRGVRGALKVTSRNMMGNKGRKIWGGGGKARAKEFGLSCPYHSFVEREADNEMVNLLDKAACACQ